MKTNMTNRKHIKLKRWATRRKQHSEPMFSRRATN